MIFVLSAELAFVNNWSLDRVAAVEKISHCAFQGTHAVAMESPLVATVLAALPAGTFSAVTIAVLKKLQANFTFQGQLFRGNFARIIVTTPEAAQNAPAGTDKQISLEALLDTSLEPTTLLGENIVDAKVFVEAARHHIIASKLNGIQVSCLERGGGGSTIVPEFSSIVDKGRSFCLVVTDSDRKSPECDMSAASKQCRKLAAQLPGVVSHDELPVRELENLIPLCLLDDLVVPQRIDAGRCLVNVVNTFPSVRLYGDMKDGTLGAKVFRMPDNASERKFLTPILQHNLKQINYCTRVEDCYAERNNGECTCVAIPKVGEIGDSFHTWLSTQSPHKALERFADPWRSAWLAVGELVLKWCCATPPMRS